MLIESSFTLETRRAELDNLLLQVMRSRALAHLGRERDYALYLALWTSIQYQDRVAARVPLSAVSFSKCYPLDTLASFTPPTSLYVAELVLRRCARILTRMRCNRNAYSTVLPSWINNNTKFGAQSDTSFGCAAYDPYELESARTDDLYWNDIQKFLMEHRYLHPVLVVYWSYRILQWSISSQSAIAVSHGRGGGGLVGCAVSDGTPACAAR